MIKIFRVIGYGILGVILYFVINNIVDKLNVFYKYTSFLVSIALLFTIIFSSEKDYFKSILCYIVTLFFVLNLRKRVEISYNFEFYMFDWLALLKNNRIVFINIVGNIILFMPLVILIYLYTKALLKSGIYSFIAVIFLELFQLITKSGIFDIVDIFLNTIGIIIGIGVCLLMKITKS